MYASGARCASLRRRTCVFKGDVRRRGVISRAAFRSLHHGDFLKTYHLRSVAQNSIRANPIRAAALRIQAVRRAIGLVAASAIEGRFGHLSLGWRRTQMMIKVVGLARKARTTISTNSSRNIRLRHHPTLHTHKSNTTISMSRIAISVSYTHLTLPTKA